MTKEKREEKRELFLCSSSSMWWNKVKKQIILSALLDLFFIEKDLYTFLFLNRGWGLAYKHYKQ